MTQPPHFPLPPLPLNSFTSCTAQVIYSIYESDRTSPPLSIRPCVRTCMRTCKVYDSRHHILFVSPRLRFWKSGAAWKVPKTLECWVWAVLWCHFDAGWVGRNRSDGWQGVSGDRSIDRGVMSCHVMLAGWVGV